MDYAPPHTYGVGPVIIHPSPLWDVAQLQREYLRLHDEDQANVQAMEGGNVNPCYHVEQ